MLDSEQPFVHRAPDPPTLPRMWKPFGKQREASEQTCIAEFRRSLSQHVASFRTVAADSGLPHGLVWHTVEAADEPLFARDAENRLIALVAVEIKFEADEDGDMDDAPGLNMIRAATALFRFQNGTWAPNPKAVFNFAPQEFLERTPAWTPITFE